MMTIAKKKFTGYDANGTDGTDYSKMSAVYKVVDSDGFSYNRVSIAATIHNSGVAADIDAALLAEIE